MLFHCVCSDALIIGFALPWVGQAGDKHSSRGIQAWLRPSCLADCRPPVTQLELGSFSLATGPSLPTPASILKAGVSTTSMGNGPERTIWPEGIDELGALIGDGSASGPRATLLPQFQSRITSKCPV